MSEALLSCRSLAARKGCKAVGRHELSSCKVKTLHLLLRLDFHGQQTHELLGPREYTMNEVAAIISQPDLKYVQVSDEELRRAMAQMGMSPDMVNLLLEMSAALNSGHMRALEPRSGRNTTSTTFETVVAANFVPAYQKCSAA